MKALRLCRACEVELPPTAFAGPYARRCNDCLAKAIARSRCKRCRTPLPLSPKGEPRKNCGSAECVAAARLEAVQKAARSKSRNAARRKTRRCASCKRVKPKTQEHFTVTARPADGPPVLNSTCKPCAAAIARDRYASDPERRRQVRERAARQRERILQRAAEDPDFARRRMEQRRRWERERVERLRARAAGELEPDPPADRGGESLPAKPLAAAIKRQAFLRQFAGVESYAPTIGVAPRQVNAWDDGGVDTVELAVADRALVRMDLLWFDVWDADDPAALLAFEGESVAA